MKLQPMKGKAQCGYILLPVVLLMSLVALVAFSLSYEGSIGRYLTLRRADPEKALYVAEAGLQYATWQVQQASCANYTDIGSTAFGNNSFTASITPDNGSPVNISATGTLDNGISRTLNHTGVKGYVKNKPNDANSGYSLDMFIDNAPDTNNANISLLDFDLAVIPPGSTVTSAVLELYAHALDTVPAGAAVTAHRLLEPWTEDGVTYQVSDGSTPWTWPANYEAAVAATSTLVIGIPGWQSWDLTAMVAGWVDGKYPNHGLVLTGTPDLYWSAFRSSDYTTDISQRPRLTVNYSCECGGSFQELVLQPGPEGQDTFIEPGANSDKNHGGSTGLVVKNAGQRTLVKFAVPTLPAGASIVSASLLMNMESLANYNLPGYLDVFRVTQYWVEGTQDGVTIPADGVTWDTYDAVTPWSIAGGDYNATLEASTPVDPALGWHSWDVTDLVTAWADGSQQNYGLMIKGRTYVQNATFTSGNGAAAELRPKLVVTYDCPCGANCIAPSDPTAFYRDEFTSLTCNEAIDYIGSDGTIDWSPWSWTEVNDSMGSCGGGVRLNNDLGSNRISLSDSGRGAERQVDLASFNRGFLTIDLRREFTATGESVEIMASPDGGTNWITIDTITGSGSDPDYTSHCYEITPYVSLNTMVGFMSYNFDNASNTLFLDNFHVSQEPCPVPPSVLTFLSTQDTWLNQEQPDTNYHNDSLMRVGESSSINNFYRPMISFDISSLPAGTNVVSATLRLYVQAVQGSQNMEVGLYRINSDWTQSTVTWNSESGGDFHPVPLSLPEIVWTTGWKEWPVPLELINEWIDGVSINYGLLLDYLGNKKNYNLQFVTQNHGNASLHPQLVIEYYE
jgi:Tfp pilus assembly protein PilX